MIEGRWAPAGKHEHRMREIARTTEGPLGVLTSCADCGKTEVIFPNKRMRKVRDGYTTETWAVLMSEAETRAELSA